MALFSFVDNKTVDTWEYTLVDEFVAYESVEVGIYGFVNNLDVDVWAFSTVDVFCPHTITPPAVVENMFIGIMVSDFMKSFGQEDWI